MAAIAPVKQAQRCRLCDKPVSKLKHSRAHGLVCSACAASLSDCQAVAWKLCAVCRDVLLATDPDRACSLTCDWCQWQD
jgi:hypothetical protein